MNINEIKINLKSIKTKKQYKQYLTLIDELIDCPENSKEEEVLELLSILVEEYEQKNYSIEPPDPISAIKLRMYEEGLKNKDLVPYIGSASRVSEVLSGKRALSLEMIKKLHKEFGVSAEVLLA
jgi:HTH-type transcriptional regulator / antitoxin HigA